MFLMAPLFYLSFICSINGVKHHFYSHRINGSSQSYTFCGGSVIKSILFTKVLLMFYNTDGFLILQDVKHFPQSQKSYWNISRSVLMINSSYLLHTNQCRCVCGGINVVSNIYNDDKRKSRDGSSTCTFMVRKKSISLPIQSVRS